MIKGILEVVGVSVRISETTGKLSGLESINLKGKGSVSSASPDKADLDISLTYPAGLDSDSISITDHIEFMMLSANKDDRIPDDYTNYGLLGICRDKYGVYEYTFIELSDNSDSTVNMDMNKSISIKSGTPIEFFRVNSNYNYVAKLSKVTRY